LPSSRPFLWKHWTGWPKTCLKNRSNISSVDVLR
jgi:hypothetical protein